MEIKDLNRPQFVLLLILICFVVSIATSITTYALLEKAPENIKSPITQVVQRTVEKIVEVENNQQALSQDEQKLLEDLKALKPLIDKLASEKDTGPASSVDNTGENVVKDDTTKPTENTTTDSSATNGTNPQ